MGKEKPSQITEKQVVEMISDFEVSDRKMMKILRKMKQIFGKKAVTPNIKEAIIERKKKVLKFFKVENTTFKDKDNDDINRQFVFTEDLELLLDFVKVKEIMRRTMLRSRSQWIVAKEECLWFFTSATVMNPRTQKTPQQNEL